MANEVTIHVKAKDDASQKMGAIGKAGKAMGAAVGISAAAAGAAVVKFGAESVKAASDLNETMNKTKIVFGKNSSEIVNWSKTSAEKLGLSQQAALAAASSFGLMFKQLGSSGAESAKLSQKVVKLAADLGSFHNLDTADVMDRISAAFRGEYDSLQQLVPTINAAKVEKEALAETGKKSAKALTQEERAMAALAIITRDSKDAMNDFAETSDGLANKQKILTARLEDIKAKIGTALLPAISDLADAVGTMFDNWEDSGRMAQDMDDLAEAARNAQEAFRGFGKANSRFTDLMLSQKGTILGWRITMLEAILVVVEAWAKINPKMKNVAKSVRGMLEETRADARRTADEINKRKIEPKIRADKRELERKARAAERELAALNRKKATPKVNADTARAMAKLAAIRASLSMLPQNKQIYVTTYYRKVVGGGKQQAFAQGGNVGHAAEGGPRGNQVLVGEGGPEIVDLPLGSHVNSNPDSQRMMATGGKGGGDTHFHFHGPVYGDHNALRRALVNMKRSGQLDVVLR